MNPTMNNGLGQYRSVNAYGAANGDRLQLIQTMLDGAMDRLASARGHVQRQETAAKGEAIGKAIGLIDGLRTSLDKERGGKLAENLDALYDYMMRRLVEANLRDDSTRLDEVAGLLDEIRTGWSAIMRNPPQGARS